MASRTWTAVVLMCGIWYAYMKWFVPVPTPVTKPLVEQAATGTGKELVANKTEGLFTQVISAPASATINTDKLSVSFSKIGGKPVFAQLKKYKDSIQKEASGIVLLGEKQQPQGLPAVFTDQKLKKLMEAEYQEVLAGQTVTYSAKTDLLDMEKEYKVKEGGYAIEVEYRLKKNVAEAREDFGHMLIPVGTIKTEYDANTALKSWEWVSYQNDATIRKNIDQIKEEEELHQGTSSWIAFGNKYFSTAVINRSEINPDIIYKKEGDFSSGYLKFPVVFKKGQNETKFSFVFYMGPKETKELEKYPSLKALIDFGMFSVIAVPMLELLRFLYKFSHNWGVAIILLTILMRAVFYPLQMKSVKSMKAMQKLQPQIAALKEKYKDDMKKQQAEQMALFKTHKVNPAGGCLPMLVQLPVFFALNAVLGYSIELYHAPFMGWILDLSAKDPIYIFPVLMGASFFVQQKITPSVGMDPIQQKMMLFMPVMFTFFMISLPSGLTIYIFLSTLLGIVQQLATKDSKKNLEIVSVAAK